MEAVYYYKKFLLTILLADLTTTKYTCITTLGMGRVSRNLIFLGLKHPRGYLNLSVRAQRGLLYLVCVSVRLMPYFSDTVNLYVELKVQHGADFYKKGFSKYASFKSYGIICLPVTSYKGTVAIFCALFRWQS